MKGVYPVFLTKTDDVILVEVPDFGILTEGKDLADAVAMARDAIGLKAISMEDAGIDIPKATSFSAIDVKNGTFYEEGETIETLVDVDLTAYRRRVDNRTVRRNVTLPNWLNIEAEEAHLNVSKVLQEALVQKLGASR